MMDPATIASLVSSVGFPIAACCVLFYLLNKQMETLNDLKIVLTKLIDKLDVDDLEVRKIDRE